MLILSSWDDGSKHDLRLAKLLKKYNIPAIFYIPTCCELSPLEITAIHLLGFEIGGHTDTHPQDLKKLSPKQQTDEILGNKLWLESILADGSGVLKVNSFCYPRGRYDFLTERIVKRCGFTNARTTVQGSIEHPVNKFRTKTSVHVYPETPRFNKPDWLKEAKRLYIKAKKEDGVFHIWSHSWEIEKFGLWKELEEFFIWMK